MAYDILGEDILGLDDVMGEDILGEDILGADDLMGAAVRRARQRRGGGLAFPKLVNKVPGVSAPSLAKLPLGFAAQGGATAGGPVSFTSTSGTTITASTRPQVPVIPRRLVVSLSVTDTAATPTTVDAYTITLNDIRVGTKSILASANGVDAKAFIAQAYGVELVGESAQPGIDITASYSITPTPSATATVRVSTTLICDSVV